MSSLRGDSEEPGRNSTVAAAAYVRTSTDEQTASIDVQLATIGRYADANGYRIVAVFQDKGRSGLDTAKRPGIRDLIAAVQSGSAQFSAILVLDVSRWGRFSSADEGAYYEYLCARAGIPVHFCNELFENDGSTGSELLKNVKRAMAREYSRDLSAKVFSGQCHLAELVYWQGGRPGYGLRRMLVDGQQVVKAMMANGDRKALQGDHVVLVPGPNHEVATVARIYRLFVNESRNEAEIAALLNAEGVPTDINRAWTRGTVHQVLTNEKYVGNNVYNRSSSKLQHPRRKNRVDLWIRKERAFRPIVRLAVFERAREIIDNRSRRLSDDELLTRLRSLLSSEGSLSGLLIDERTDLPSSSVYRRRFGSLLRAYALIGYEPERDFSYLAINRLLRCMHPAVVDDIVIGLENAGARVDRENQTDLLRVNDEFTISVAIARSRETKTGALRWKVRFDTVLVPDITIVVRMDRRNEAALDYYLLPSIDMTETRLRLSSQNGLALDAYRFGSLDFLFAISSRGSFSEAA